MVGYIRAELHAEPRQCEVIFRRIGMYTNAPVVLAIQLFKPLSADSLFSLKHCQCIAFLDPCRHPDKPKGNQDIFYSIYEQTLGKSNSTEIL